VKSDKAKELAETGAEVVAANVLKPDTIQQACAGSYGFFAVTNFWDKEQMGKELAIGKTLVDAAKKAEVQHFIWASLANAEAESKGKYKVPHFSDKAKVKSYAKTVGFPYHTYVAAPFYYQNWGSMIKPKKNEDGSLTFTFPITSSDIYWSHGDIRELGTAVVGALKNPKGWGNGDFIAVCGEHVPLSHIFKTLSNHLGGTKVTLNSVPREVYAKLFPGADELADMLQWFEEYGYYGKTHDINAGHKAKGSALKSFGEYLKDVNFKLVE